MNIINVLQTTQKEDQHFCLSSNVEKNPTFETKTKTMAGSVVKTFLLLVFVSVNSALSKRNVP